MEDLEKQAVRIKTLSPALKAYLVKEDTPQNPRSGLRNPLGTIAAFHSHRHLSEVSGFEHPGMFLLQLFSSVLPQAEKHEPISEVSEINPDLQSLILAADFPGVLLDLDLVDDAFDPSMTRMEVGDFTCQWNRNQIGWYYATDEMLSDWNMDRRSGRAAMLNDLRAYQEYRNGNVYAMELRDGPILLERRGNIINTSLGDFMPSDAQLNRVLENMVKVGDKHLIAQQRWMPSPF